MDDGHYDRVLALQAEDDFPLALRELRIQQQASQLIQDGFSGPQSVTSVEAQLGPEALKAFVCLENINDLFD